MADRSLSSGVPRVLSAFAFSLLCSLITYLLEGRSPGIVSASARPGAFPLTTGPLSC